MQANILRFFLFEQTQFKSHLENGLPAKSGGAHEDHPHSGHGGWGGVVHVVHFKHQLARWRHCDSVTISQSQCFVVVQH